MLNNRNFLAYAICSIIFTFFISSCTLRDHDSSGKRLKWLPKITKKDASKCTKSKKCIIHKVQRGESLYSISLKYEIDYRDIASWNNIKKPYKIFPKQKLAIYKLNYTPKKHKSKKYTKSKGQKPPTLRNTNIKWVWPTQGRLIKNFQASRPGKKGLNIAGKVGQKILTTAPGKVVYSGSGLIGYGKLIIIKHNENFLSAYGHNRKILVKEGQAVKAKQKIAELGTTGANRAMLHFEIRYKGKPVDPMKYLPKL
jgi:lipoprotein NlpD